MSKKKESHTKPPAPTPADEVRAFVAEQVQLQKAFISAEARVVKAEADLDEARKALATAQCERLVQNPDADLDGEDCAESAEFVSASLRLEECRAALGGVRHRIVARDGQLLSIREKLRAERQQFNITTIQRFINETLEPAAAAFAAVLKQGVALEAALAETIPTLHHLPEHGDWREDPEAVTIHDDHCELKQLGEALDQFGRDAEHRIFIAEQSKKFRAGFDPTAKYEVIRPFLCYGKTYQPGQTIDGHEIPLALLARIYETRKLKLLEPSKTWEDA